MYAFGYSLAGWLGFACYFFPADSKSAAFSWRFPLAVQVIAPMIVLAGSAFIPFSPRWLLSQDRREEAFEIMKRLHGRPDDPDHINARQEFYLIEKQFELDKTLPQRPLEIFRTKPNLKRCLTACMLMWGDQFLGIFVSRHIGRSGGEMLLTLTQVITNYGVLIYASLGLSGFRPLLLNACWSKPTLCQNPYLERCLGCDDGLRLSLTCDTRFQLRSLSSATHGQPSLSTDGVDARSC